MPISMSWSKTSKSMASCSPSSFVQRKALTPNDFTCRAAVAERLENFERYFESIAQPFEWKFARTDLNALIAPMRSRYAEAQHLKLAA